MSQRKKRHTTKRKHENEPLELEKDKSHGLYGVECTSVGSAVRMKFTAKRTANFSASVKDHGKDLPESNNAFIKSDDNNNNCSNEDSETRIRESDHQMASSTEDATNNTDSETVLIKSQPKYSSLSNHTKECLHNENNCSQSVQGTTGTLTSKKQEYYEYQEVNVAVQCALTQLPAAPVITDASAQTRNPIGQPQPSHFSIENIKKDPEYLELYTNFPGLEHFTSCFSLVKSMNNFERPETGLSLEDEFFLTVVRLSLGVPVFDLSYRFGISRQAASRIFMKWLSGMYKAFRQIIIWPTKDVVKKFMPAVFKTHFPFTRCLLGIIEIPTEKQLHGESTPHSNRSTLKALVAMTPSGCLSFASEPVSGTCSDHELFVDSGILSKLERGDSIMVPAKIYGQIKDVCEMRSIPVLPLGGANKGRRSLADEQDAPVLAVMSLRICERQIERILKYRILEYVPNALCCTGLINKIFYVCAFLTNYYPPLVTESPVGE